MKRFVIMILISVLPILGGEPANNHALVSIGTGPGTGTSPCPCKYGVFSYGPGYQFLINGNMEVCASAADGCITVIPADCQQDSIVNYQQSIAICGGSVSGLSMAPAEASQDDSSTCGSASATADASEDNISAFATPNSFGASVSGITFFFDEAEVECGGECSPGPFGRCAAAHSNKDSNTTISVPVNVCQDSLVYLDAIAWVIGSCPGEEECYVPVLRGEFSLADQSGELQLWGGGLARDTRAFLLTQGSHTLQFELTTNNDLSAWADCDEGPTYDQQQCVDLHAFMVNVGFIQPASTVILPAADCNDNGIADETEILMSPVNLDINGNGILDSCEFDCNGNGLPDDWEIAKKPAKDCNGNGLLDSCEIICNPTLDSNGNGVIDSCEP